LLRRRSEREHDDRVGAERFLGLVPRHLAEHDPARLHRVAGRRAAGGERGEHAPRGAPDDVRTHASTVAARAQMRTPRRLLTRTLRNTTDDAIAIAVAIAEPSSPSHGVRIQLPTTFTSTVSAISSVCHPGCFAINRICPNGM